MSTTGISLPVGAVVPYCGLLTNAELMNLGWSICNGALLKNATYPALYTALGTANGGDGVANFNLPDYQGRFLRGLDTSGKIDKGASSRTAPASGGASGALVGSLEGFATANSTQGFQASINNIPSDNHKAYSGSNDDMLVDGGPTTFTSDGGGDAETRPYNAYVNFIIKLLPSALLPTGMVAPFAGSYTAAELPQYVPCNGTSLSTTTYQPLFLAISNLHGGSGGQFNVPDYRGRFLRGADNGTKRDPDASTRTAMNPNGAVGDSVGSVQGYATAPPVNPFSISISVSGSEKTSDKCAGHDNSSWNSGDVAQPFTASGGDHETRPVNVNADYYIFTEIDTNTTDNFPVGAIIGFPGNGTPPDTNWLACTGSSLPIIPTFQALYNAISTANGGDGKQDFYLPNYQGMFLRGTDYGAGRDVDAGARTQPVAGSGASGDNVGSLQGYATAQPVSGAITGSISHLPTSDSDNAAAVLCSTVANWNGGSQNIAVTGGDNETRPINANIIFYIKYALS